MTQGRTVEYSAFRWTRLVPVFAGLLAIDLVLYQLFYYLWDAISLGIELGLLKSIVSTSQKVSDFISSCGYDRMAKFYSDLVLFNLFAVIALNNIIIINLNKYFKIYKIKSKKYWSAAIWWSVVVALLIPSFTAITIAQFFWGQCADYLHANVGNMWELAFVTVWVSLFANSLGCNSLAIADAR